MRSSGPHIEYILDKEDALTRLEASILMDAIRGKGNRELRIWLEDIAMFGDPTEAKLAAILCGLCGGLVTE